MILTAALSATLLLPRAFGDTILATDRWLLSPPREWGGVPGYVQLLLEEGPLWAAACALIGSATVLAMRARRSRPRIERLARQPGFVACSVAVLSAVALAALLMIYSLFFRPLGGQSLLYNPSKLFVALVLLMPVPTGIAVMASWSTLALNRRRSPEPTWLDRLGRGIGYIWLLLMLVGAGHFSVFLGIAIE